MEQTDKNAIDAMEHLIKNIVPDRPVDFHIDRDYVSLVLQTDNAKFDERGSGRHTFEVPRELWAKHIIDA